MSEIEVTYDGPKNLVVECTECGHETGISVSTPYKPHPSYTTYEHCTECGVWCDHEAVREAERGEFDGDHICDDCGEMHSNTMDAGLCCPDEDSDDDDEDPMTDGGQPTADEEFDDAEIKEAIDANAADATVEDLRDVLQTLQHSVEEVWATHMDSVEDNAMELVAIDGDVLVFADHTNQFWNAEFDIGPLGERDLGRGVQVAAKSLHHKWARRHTDYDWGVDDPIVVRKPDRFDAGQRLVEAVMLNLTSRGLSPRQAWAVWGVLAGNSRNNWASRMGYDSHSGVSNAVREAKEKIPLPYL